LRLKISSSWKINLSENSIKSWHCWFGRKNSVNAQIGSAMNRTRVPDRKEKTPKSPNRLVHFRDGKSWLIFNVKFYNTIHVAYKSLFLIMTVYVFVSKANTWIQFIYRLFAVTIYFSQRESSIFVCLLLKPEWVSWNSWWAVSS
jgi:hypothetical protein